MGVIYLILGILAATVFFLIREIKLRNVIKKMIYDLEFYKLEMRDEIVEELQDQREAIHNFSEFSEDAIDSLGKDVREQFSDNMAFREEIWGILMQDETVGEFVKEHLNVEADQTAEELKVKVDEILLKIHDKGIKSITSEELSTLRVASSKGK